jgi:N-acetylglucosamine-6-phosphate deacetylase
LPASFLKVALRAKGVERAVLVTDASTPAGCAPGRYNLGEQEVDLTPDERVVLAGQNRLAGSALRMNRGVENLMKLAGLSLSEAVSMATTNPARVGRIASRQRGLAPDERADLVQFRYDERRKRIEVAATYVSGRLVYSGN